MAKIATYIIDTDVQLDDMVIGTDVNNSNITKNYRIGDIVALASGGGKDEGVITIRKKGENQGLEGNVDFIAGTGIELKQDDSENSITITSLNTDILRQFGVVSEYLDGDAPIEGSFVINSNENVLYLKSTSTDGGGLKLVSDNTNTVDFSLLASGAKAGTFKNANITVNKYGILTTAEDGETGTSVIPNQGECKGDVLTLQSLTIDNVLYCVPSQVDISVESPLNKITKDGVIQLSIDTASSTSSGVLNIQDYNSFVAKQDKISLTTTGEGTASFINNILNIPLSQKISLTTTGTGAATLSQQGVLNIPTPAEGGGIKQLKASPPISASVNGDTGNIQISQSSSESDGFLSAVDFNSFKNKQDKISLTTTGTGGATLTGSVLNIPTPTSAKPIALTTEGVSNVSVLDASDLNIPLYVIGGLSACFDPVSEAEGFIRHSTPEKENDSTGIITLESGTKEKYFYLSVEPSIGVSILFTAGTVDNAEVVHGIYPKLELGLNGTGIGIRTNSNLQRWFGLESDVLKEDIKQAWITQLATGGRENEPTTICLPTNASVEEGEFLNPAQGTILSNVSQDSKIGRIWMSNNAANSEGGEVAYVQKYQTKTGTVDRVQKIQHYGKKAYDPLRVSGLAYTWDAKISFSAVMTIATAGNYTLEILNPENGDYGNLIIDTRGLDGGKFQLDLGSGSRIGNSGGQILNLAAGQLHTATFTYYSIPDSSGSTTLVSGYLWTFVEDYA